MQDPSAISRSFLCSFFVAKFISSHSFQMFRAQSDARGRQTALIEEMIGNQKVVQAFGYENRSSERFAAINEELRDASQKAVFYSSLTNPSTRCVNNIIYAGVALAGAFLIPGGHLTVGGLSVLLAYANQYMKPFNDISSVITELQNALACATRIFDLLEEEPSMTSPVEVFPWTEPPSPMFPDMPSAEAMAWFSRIPGSSMELSVTTSVSESRILLMRT